MSQLRGRVGGGGGVRKMFLKSLDSLCSTVWQSTMHTVALAIDPPVSQTDSFPLCPYLSHRCPLSSADVWVEGREGEGGGAERAGGSVGGKTAAWRLSRASSCGSNTALR